MSDCVKCWNNPCLCGHDYRRMVYSQRKNLIKAILAEGLTYLEKRAILLEVEAEIKRAPRN